MSRKPASARTNPPDRDGDGRPGGSLPGNKTVESAKGPQPEVIGQSRSGPDPETAPGEGALTDPAAAAIETFRSEGDAEAVQEPSEWTRDNAYIHEALCMVSEGWQFEDRLTPDHVADWTDQQARDAEAWAEAVLDTADGVTPDVPDFLAPFAADAEPVQTLAETEAAGLEADDAERDEDETFTAEEIAAGKTPVVEQEGEAATTAAEASEPAQAELATIEPEGPTDQPVAVRLDELRRLVDNRWLYRTADGFSPSYSAPFVSAETVQVWIDNGLAEDRPSAGREGGVFVTAKAQRAVSQRRAA